MRIVYFGFLIFISMTHSSCSSLHRNETGPNPPNLLIIVSDPSTWGWSEILARNSLLPIFPGYDKVVSLSGDRANLAFIRQEVASLGTQSFDVILLAHSDKNGYHILRDDSSKPTEISPAELGHALSSDNLRYFYTSGCYGASGFEDLKTASNAQALVGHERVTMVPAIPFFALKFFSKVNRGSSPQEARDKAWQEINSNWIFKNVLIPLNEFDSGLNFKDSSPIIVMR